MTDKNNTINSLIKKKREDSNKEERKQMKNLDILKEREKKRKRERERDKER